MANIKRPLFITRAGVVSARIPTKTLAFRCTEDEYKMICVMAKIKKCSKSDLIREGLGKLYSDALAEQQRRKSFTPPRPKKVTPPDA